MSRPEHVRCLHCIFWKPPEDPEERGLRPMVGDCGRHGAYTAFGKEQRSEEDWCWRFRQEWPEPPRFGISSGCICGNCESCKERGVPPGESMQETIDSFRALADSHCARCHRPFRPGDARVHPGEKCPKGWDCLVCGDSGLYADEKCSCT